MGHECLAKPPPSWDSRCNRSIASRTVWRRVLLQMPSTLPPAPVRSARVSATCGSLCPAQQVLSWRRLASLCTVPPRPPPLTAARRQARRRQRATVQLSARRRLRGAAAGLSHRRDQQAGSHAAGRGPRRLAASPDDVMDPKLVRARRHAACSALLCLLGELCHKGVALHMHTATSACCFAPHLVVRTAIIDVPVWPVAAAASQLTRRC
jgi:hypothetical protein